MFTLEKFELKAKSALPLPEGELTCKQGYLVNWKGVTAELSPLTSMNGEKLKECHQELLTYRDKLIDLPSKLILEKPFFGLDIPLPQNNTVLFCLESLLLLKALENKKASVQINSMGSLKDQERIEKEISNGLKCLKFKISKTDSDNEKDFLLSLPKKLILRLDANQKLKMPLESYYKSLNIDYLEEPFLEISNYQNLDIPFALDENRSKWREISNSHFKAIIVKPSLEYSLSGTFQLAKETSKKKIQIIVSSAYETPYGLKALLLLASLLDQKYGPLTHGLAGLNWFEAPLNGLVMSPQSLSKTS
jgi:O-succinylbenzoate synthase